MKYSFNFLISFFCCWSRAGVSNPTSGWPLLCWVSSYASDRTKRKFDHIRKMTKAFKQHNVFGFDLKSNTVLTVQWTLAYRSFFAWLMTGMRTIQNSIEKGTLHLNGSGYIARDAKNASCSPKAFIQRQAAMGNALYNN